MMAERAFVAAALAIVAACGGLASRAVPAPAPEPVSTETVAGRCFRLLRRDSTPVRRAGLFWSASVKMDTVPSLRHGRLEMLRSDGWLQVTTLAPASERLVRDTVEYSTRWSIPGPWRLRIARTTGFQGETVNLVADGSRWIGERAFWTDMVVEGERRDADSVQFVPVDCPDRRD